MKSKILVVLFIVISISLTAQRKGSSGFSGMFMGFRGGATTDWIFNKHVSQITASSQDMQVSFGNCIGFTMGYDFTEVMALSLDINYNSYKQNYTGDTTYGGPFNYKSTTKMNFIDVPLLFRYGGGAYVEAGPVFTYINKASFKLDAEIDSLDLTKSDAGFESISIGAALGFGGRFYIGERVIVDIGFRGTYGLTDSKGVNGFGQSKEEVTTIESLSGIDYGSADFSSHLFKIEAVLALKFKLYN